MDNVNGLSVDGLYADAENCNNGKNARNNEDNESEYDSDDDSFHTPYSSDENEIELSRRKKKRKLVYNPKCNKSTFEFEVGMIFENYQQFRQCVVKYASSNGYQIK